MSKYPQLDLAITNLKKNGTPDNEIRRQLKAAGWSSSDIKESYKSVGNVKVEVELESPKKSSFNISPMGKLIIFILILIFAAAGAIYYFEFDITPFVDTFIEKSGSYLMSGWEALMSFLQKSKENFCR